MPQMVSDELYPLASIKEMGGYGVPQGVNRESGVKPCLPDISPEQLLDPLPFEVALSAREQGIASVQPSLEIFPDELFCCLEERTFSADPALHSLDEYPFVFKVNVREFE